MKVKDSYFRALFYRLKSRQGAKKAIVAVAHSLLVTWYHMVKNGTCFHDLGAEYFHHLDADRLRDRHVKHLKTLGYEVILTPIAA
jgi:hypothetical protein